jgi:transposase
MESLRVERFDHFGLIACAIKDLGLSEMLDSRLVPDEQEVMTPGEAVAGMMLNGLGFTHRPLSWTPQFFANHPLDLLVHDGVEAARFNRFTLGRTLDEVQAYGGDLWFSELALAICTRESMEQRFNHLDTPSFSLRGASVPESEAQAITLPHGDAKDHRPDVKQAVLALLVSQDGGVPFVSKSWDGNASETKIFQERAEALLATFQASPGPRSLVADAKRSTAAKAANLSKLGFITRIPGTRKLVTQVITQALQWDTGHRMAETTRSQRIE